MTNTTKQRSNHQISLSFGRDELQLLDILDEERKKEHLSRSGWFKNQIRKRKRTPLENALIGDF